MKVFIIRKKGFALLVIIYIVAIFALGAIGAKGIQAVSTQEIRLLPIYSVKTQGNSVSLGINCAWGEEDMPIILKALSDESVKATFFVVGDWAEKYPQQVKAIYNAGHEIGTHSHTHPDMSTISSEKIIEELSLSAEIVENIIGEKPLLFRPPSGSYNNTLIKTATAEGYYVIQWNRDSLDWQGKSCEEIIDRCTRKLISGDIILLHSGTKNTAQALPLLIEKIYEKGYSIVTVGELIYKEDFTLDHEGRQHKN